MATTPERAPLEFERPWLYPKQAAFLFTPARYSVVEASTKSGKTVGCIAWLFENAALEGGSGRNYWWVAPTLPVAKIAFRRMKRYLPRAVYHANETDCTLALVNGATIWFKGADRPDLLFGEDVYACVIDEASRCKAEAWTAVRTTITATKGQVRIIGNVRGKHNWAYRLARQAESGAPHMAYFKLTAHDAVKAGIYDAAELEDAQRTMEPSAFQELYFAEAADDGSNPFGWESIVACTVTEPEAARALADAEPVAFGWDFARAEDWTVGVALGKDYEVCRVHRWQHQPGSEIKRQVKDANAAVPAWGDSTSGMRLWRTSSGRGSR